MIKIIKSHLFVSFLLCILKSSLYISFTSQSTSASPVIAPQDTSSLTVSEANELILKNKGNPEFVIIDVRSPEEYNDGHIEGCMNIDYKSENFKNEISKLNRDITYLVYCRSGRRSKNAQEVMFNLGFKNVINLLADSRTGKKNRFLL